VSGSGREVLGLLDPLLLLLAWELGSRHMGTVQVRMFEDERRKCGVQHRQRKEGRKDGWKEERDDETRGCGKSWGPRQRCVLLILRRSYMTLCISLQCMLQQLPHLPACFCRLAYCLPDLTPGGVVHVYDEDDYG
jgi:hypothetical protein